MSLILRSLAYLFPVALLRRWQGNRLLTLFCLAFGTANAIAAPFSLRVVSVAQNIATLQLSGDSGASYGIEGSTNLNTWFPVGAGLAVDGSLIQQHTNLSGHRALYYRGTSATAALPFPTIHVDRDRLFSIDAVLAAGEAQDVRVALPDGTAFTLHVPTNAVFSDTRVTLSVVTNAIGIPAADGFRAGIILEPEGILLAAPAILEIEFPKVLPTNRMASYSFENDGKGLHLVPDLVGTHTVRIFVNRFSGYGTGAFTLAELNGLAATVPPVAAPLRHATRQATLEECYPEEAAEAKAMQKELDKKLTLVEHQIAAILGRERQEQLLGKEDLDNPVLLQAFGIGQQFYDAEIQPRIAAASKKSLVATQLLPRILGWARQRQLLSMGDDGNILDLYSLVCPLFKRYDQQILECCRTRGGDRRHLQALLGNERQRQLLGATNGECGSFDFEQSQKECAPKWMVRLRIQDVGSFSTNRETKSNRYHKDESYKYLADLIIDTVEETITPPVLFLPGSTNLVIRISGKGQGHHIVNERYDDLDDACSVVALAGTGARPASLPRPADGGFELHRFKIAQSSVETNLVVTINARLPGPGGEAFGMVQSIVFQIPSIQVPQKGLIQRTERELTSTGCMETRETEDLDAVDSYGGNFFSLRAGTFQYEPGLVQFHWEEPSKLDDLPLVRKLTLEMRKLQ